MALLIPSALRAGEDDPKGLVILEISGALANASNDGVRRYDMQQIEGLGLHEIITETPWTPGRTSFTGVLMRDLLADAGAQGDVISAVALNDYSVDIPISDFDRYNVIMATKMNGEYLTIRNRGPLWVIYPYSDVRSLRNELFYTRSIWQLRSIEIR
ncbi:molybdopterin-dependent oxidoreductase [Candidatus Rhodobacter oscarellae]|nr:molybdopterin-dependent oxidoreductase [Candidatus Rhodobacter lobularis]